jgi:hypothetical protein
MIRFAIALIAAQLIACASTPSITRESVDGRVRATFVGTEAQLFWVPSPSAFYDAGRVWRLSVDPASADAPVVNLLRSASSKPVRLAVAGPSTTLARHEIIAALTQVERPLPKLELSFFGDPSDVVLVKEAVERKGGTYVPAH